MKIGEFKDICRIVNTNGLIDEFVIKKDGHVIGVDAAKTFVADLKYNIELPKDIGVTNVKGIKEILSKFTDDTEVEILEDKLHIVSGTKFANIPLNTVSEAQFQLPQLTEDDYQVIAEGIDHNIFNTLGKMRPDAIINEVYYFYVSDGKILYQVGEDGQCNMGDLLAIPKKFVPNATVKFTMNVSECFKSITTTANLYILIDKLAMIESKVEKYTIRYYLAPRVD